MGILGKTHISLEEGDIPGKGGQAPFLRSTGKVNPYVIGNAARPGCVSRYVPSIPNRRAKLA
jgi:hypothetical protein